MTEPASPATPSDDAAPPHKLHPMVYTALDYLRGRLSDLTEVALLQDAFSSVAIEGNALAAELAATFHRLMRREPVGERYLLALALWLVMQDARKNSEVMASAAYRTFLLTLAETVAEPVRAAIVAFLGKEDDSLGQSFATDLLKHEEAILALQNDKAALIRKIDQMRERLGLLVSLVGQGEALRDVIRRKDEKIALAAQMAVSGTANVLNSALGIAIETAGAVAHQPESALPRRDDDFDVEPDQLYAILPAGGSIHGIAFCRSEAEHLAESLGGEAKPILVPGTAVGSLARLLRAVGSADADTEEVDD